MTDPIELAELLPPVVNRSRDAVLAALARVDSLDEETLQELRRMVRSTNDFPGLARAMGEALGAAGHDRHLVNEFYRASFYMGDDWRSALENPLFAYLSAHRDGPSAQFWVNHLAIYHQNLAVMRGERITLLDISDQPGPRLDLWRWYLGGNADVVGLSADRASADEAAGRHSVLVSDAADKTALDRVQEDHGPIDVVVDGRWDAPDLQVLAIESIFGRMAEGGLYFVEAPGVGGDPVDTLQAAPSRMLEWWIQKHSQGLSAKHRGDRSEAGEWARDLQGIHLFDGLVMLSKSSQFSPFYETGESLPSRSEPHPVPRLAEGLAAGRGEASERLTSSEWALDAAGVDSVAEGGTHRPVASGLRRLPRRSDFVERELRRREVELAAAYEELDASYEQLREMRRTASWRVTYPLRALRRMTRG